MEQGAFNAELSVKALLGATFKKELPSLSEEEIDSVIAKIREGFTKAGYDDSTLFLFEIAIRKADQVTFGKLMLSAQKYNLKAQEAALEFAMKKISIDNEVDELTSKIKSAAEQHAPDEIVSEEDASIIRDYMKRISNIVFTAECLKNDLEKQFTDISKQMYAESFEILGLKINQER